MASNAGCFVEFYARAHRSVECIVNSPSTARLQTTTRLILHCCVHFSTTVQLTLFSLYYIAREKNVSLQIFESFFPDSRSMPIFIPLSVRNFSRAIGAQSLFL
ncbi:hypothetical protein TNCV_2754981 [Trichonephila clavipes]|nr:hypothetical protein TNCV_2754981 [Trichonephila clavipes]